MLFGEYDFSSPEIAEIMVMCLCGMALTVLASVFLLLRKDKITPAALLNILFLLSALAGLVFFRAQYKQTAAQDFRYIVPSLIPFVMAWSSTVAQWQRRDLWFLYIPAYASAALLIASGIVLYELFFYYLP